MGVHSADRARRPVPTGWCRRPTGARRPSGAAEGKSRRMKQSAGWSAGIASWTIELSIGIPQLIRTHIQLVRYQNITMNRSQRERTWSAGDMGQYWSAGWIAVVWIHLKLQSQCSHCHHYNCCHTHLSKLNLSLRGSEAMYEARMSAASFTSTSPWVSKCDTRTHWALIPPCVKPWVSCTKESLTSRIKPQCCVIENHCSVVECIPGTW